MVLNGSAPEGLNHLMGSSTLFDLRINVDR
jgi:hypothetical protein